MSISRRDALLGATAAALTTAAITAPLALKAASVRAALGGDTVLLARIAQFHEAHRAHCHMWERAKARRAMVEAMPNCPVAPGYPTRGDYHKHNAFLKVHDAYRHHDEANRLSEQAGALAKSIFEIPAMTWRGAVEKFKIAHRAIGNYDGDGDEGLEAYQDWKKPWMATVAKDFERLAGGLPS